MPKGKTPKQIYLESVSKRKKELRERSIKAPKTKGSAPKRKAVKFCPHCNRMIGNYKEHLKLFHRRSNDALNRPSTIWGGHWESNRRRH